MRGTVRPKAVFDLTESRFGFIVNPNMDSLANRMVWIFGLHRFVGDVGSDVIVIYLRL